MNKLYTLLHSIVNTLNRVVRDKVDTSQLNTEVNNALNTAKESGQFDGAPGKDGAPGQDGVSVTHEWNGTTLKVTSASGTTSADLKGEPGNSGVHFGSDEPKDDSSKVWVDLSGQGDVLDYISSPDTAEVGQTMVVKAVDENGKPTQWEALEMSGGDTMEFIKTIKLTEEVSTIKINTDADGNPLNLKRIVVAVGTVGGTPNENRSNYWVHPNSINAGVIRIDVAQGVYAKGASVSSVVDIQMITDGVYLLNSSCNSNPKQTWGSYNKEPTIKEINFGVSTEGYTFGVNTYFHVMGVKA